jgi:transcriptional regulator with XRE-family HTH domain
VGANGIAARLLAGAGMPLGRRIEATRARDTNDKDPRRDASPENGTAGRSSTMRCGDAVVLEAIESGLGGSRRCGQRDRSVASWVRLRRCALGLIQQRLDELIGVNCQQVQKYETGATRISAGWLQAIAEALNIDVGYFFAPVSGRSLGEPAQGLHTTVDLAGHFDLLSPAQQRAISRLVRTLAITRLSVGAGPEESSAQTDAAVRAPVAPAGQESRRRAASYRWAKRGHAHSGVGAGSRIGRAPS